MPGRILVAEDEEHIASLLRKALTKHGFDITVAGDGAAALELLTAEPFDLLILDLGLPRIDGEEVLRTLRGRGHTLPVVVLTARDDVRDKVEALEGGADDYVTKPFSVHELLARVRARLRQPATAVSVRPGGPQEPAGADRVDDAPAGPQRRVLIVEDEPRIGAFLSRGVRSGGFEVVLAEDGEVGLFLVRTEPYDVVVLDLHLPGKDGIDVLSAVREARPGIPVVILTGQDSPEVRERALAAGAAMFITKPFRVADVRAAIAQLAGAPRESA
ncbi:MAG: response regulator [Actinomycetota bacterium]|nr:response regulator [Actinomycetota bacterium]